MRPEPIETTKRMKNNNEKKYMRQQNDDEHNANDFGGAKMKNRKKNSYIFD